MAKLDLSRRQFLRGAGGLALALPLFTQHEARAQAPLPGGLPKRLVLFYVAEGVEKSHWWPTLGPTRTPTDFSLEGTSLAALAPHRQHMTIVRGVNTESTKPIRRCYHGFCMPHVLTGGPLSAPISYTDPVKGAAVTLPGGISVDRAIARAVQGSAPFASYELGVRAYADKGVQVLSFDQAGAGRYPQNSPYKAFQTLFGAGGAAGGRDLSAALAELHLRRMSVLDAVKGDIGRVRCALGRDGLAKLDAHLASVRTIEQQLQTLQQKQQGAPALQVAAEWDSAFRDLARVPDLARVQLEIARTALAADLTRVVLIQLAHTISRWRFPFVPGVVMSDADHHDKLSHADNPATRPQAIEDKKKIYTWFANQYRSLLEQLKAVPEGTGTLLDSTALVYFSEMGYGNTHDANNIPIVIAGGAQRRLKTGAYFDLNAAYKGLYSSSTGTGRSIGDLWLTLCHAFGLPLPRFGEEAFSKGPISELLV